jgi:hypothetical protein
MTEVTSFGELLDSSLFQADSLSTKWDKSCVQYELDRNKRIDSIDPAVIEDAFRRSVTNIVITEQGVPFGFVNAQRFANRPLHESDVTRFLQEFPQNSYLLFLGHSFLDAGLLDYPLFAVVDGAGNPTGIINFADLNRRCVYLYSYVLLLFLEQWSKKRIALKVLDKGSAYVEGWCRRLTQSTAFTSLGEGRASNLISDLKQITKDVRNLLECYYRSLVFMVLNGEGLETERIELQTRGLTNDILSFSCELRNDVDHPINLLIPDDSRASQNNLTQMVKFWDAARKFIVPYDYNEKERGIGSILHEIL